MRRVAELESENRKLKKRLEEAQIIIEFQKKGFSFCRMEDLVDEYLDYHSGL